MTASPRLNDRRPLTTRGERNLLAFARLVGVVRFFHPDPAVGEADWDAFVPRHLPDVEGARSDDELAVVLRQAMDALAPDVQLQVDGAPIEPANVPAHTHLRFRVHTPAGVMAHGLALHPGHSVTLPIQDAVPEDATVTLTFPNETEPRAVTVPVPDPARPYPVHLTGTLTAWVPLAQWTNESASRPLAWPDRPAHAATPNRPLRLAAILQLWTVLQHFFPYREHLPQPWSDALLAALRAAAGAPSALALRAILERFMAPIGDAHVQVLYGDRGLHARRRLPFALTEADGRFVVWARFVGAPEHLALGDEVLSVAGEALPRRIQRLERQITGSPQHRRQVALKVALMAHTRRAATVRWRARDTGQVHQATLPYDVFRGLLAPATPPPVQDLGDGVLAIDLIGADEAVYEAHRDALHAARGLVVDARGYPNPAALRFLAHLTDQPLRTAPFLAPVVTRPDGQDWVWVDFAYDLVQPQVPRWTSAVAFVTDANDTLSWAETVLGLVDGAHLGPRVGSASVGVNGTGTWVHLPGGSAVRYTGLHVTKHDGTPLYGVGYGPDVPADRTAQGVAQGRDEPVEVAKQVVLTLLGDHELQGQR